jgi:hypothetical protein
LSQARVAVVQVIDIFAERYYGLLEERQSVNDFALTVIYRRLELALPRAPQKGAWQVLRGGTDGLVTGG